MLHVNQFIGFGVGSSVPPTYSYRTTLTDGTDGSSFSFSSVDIGSESATRHVLVCIMHRGGSGSGSVTDCTIAGITGTELLEDVSNVGANGSASTAIYIAAVPTGTTGTISFNLSASDGRAAISVYAVYDLSSTTPKDTATGATDTSDPVTLDVDTAPGDLIFAVSAGASGSGTTTATWAGLTENADTTVEVSQTCHTVASATATVTETPRTISCDFSTSVAVTSGCCIVMA